MELPLGRRFKAKATWDPIVGRVERWLDLWKSKFLSEGRKLILLRSVLSNLPTYYMSLFVAPKFVILALEKIIPRILWGSVDNAQKIHLIGWGKACASIDFFFFLG